MNLKSDIAIIGAGPIGLFTVFAAGMLDLKCVLVDCLNSIGGQCTALYPEKPIYDIPGYPKILAKDLIDNLHIQAKPFNPDILLENRVEEFVYGGIWKLATDKGNNIEAKCVIIATGGGAFKPKRPPLENLELFEGKSIFYAVQDLSIFKGKNIVIAGGGDSAVDWAINLAPLARKVYIIHRRDAFRAAPGNVEIMRYLVSEGKIELVVPYQLYNLTGSSQGELHTVQVADLGSNIRSIEADILLPLFGLEMDNNLIKNSMLASEHKHIKVDPATMETSLKGMYAVGDICSYLGKLKLILTGFAEASLACRSAYNIINPDRPLHFEYSTSKGVPGV